VWWIQYCVSVWGGGYSLGALEQYMPWYSRLYIVTNGRVREGV
jgi:hypothetical protein